VIDVRWNHLCIIVLCSILLLPLVYAEREPKVIFDDWIVPKKNLTIMEDVFYVRNVRSDPTVILLEQDNETNILYFGDEESNTDYLFKVTDMRFNIDNLHLKNSKGVPLFGLIDYETDEFLYSYRLEVRLIKPVIEIKHTINNQFSNDKPETSYAFDVNEPLNITTTIINHGIHSVEYSHSEPLPEEFELLEYKDVVYDEESNTLTKTGIVDEETSFSYSITTEQDAEFQFNSATTIIYNDEEIEFHERNVTTITTKTGISLKNGFFNNQNYDRKLTFREIGQIVEYRITISNDREENISMDIEANFPEGVEATYDGYTLYDGLFSEQVHIDAEDEKTLDFELLVTRTGKHHINASGTTRLHGKRKRFTDSGVLEGNYNPITPRVVFSEEDENKTSEILMYLTNTNTNTTVYDVSFTIDTQFGLERDVLEYEASEIDIPSTLLVNYIEHRLTGNDSITIHGHFSTRYGEVMEFGTKITPEQGYENKFDTIKQTIMKENKFDTRYETQEENSDFISGMALFLDPNKPTVYIFPIVFFALILGIQFAINKFRKNI
jgi:hypothetical protein